MVCTELYLFEKEKKERKKKDANKNTSDWYESLVSVLKVINLGNWTYMYDADDNKQNNVTQNIFHFSIVASTTTCAVSDKKVS